MITAKILLRATTKSASTCVIRGGLFSSYLFGSLTGPAGGSDDSGNSCLNQDGYIKGNGEVSFSQAAEQSFKVSQKREKVVFSPLNNPQASSSQTPLSSVSNVKLNHRIQDSETLKELVALHDLHHVSFNLINYSTLCKRLSKLPKGELSEEFFRRVQSDLQPLVFQRHIDVGGGQAFLVNEEELSAARAIASLSFNLQKIQERQRNSTEASTIISQILNSLDEEGVRLFCFMNEQEQANFISSLCKRGQTQRMQMIEKHILQMINRNTEIRTLLSLFYSITVLKGDDQSKESFAEVLVGIDKALVFMLSNQQAMRRLSARDLSDILYCYSRNQRITIDSAIFELLSAAATGDSSKTSSSNKPKGSSSSGSFPGSCFFQNNRIVDPLSVSSILSSIGSFTTRRFNSTFIAGLEDIALITKFSDARQLANSLRGLTQFYTPSEAVFKHFEKRAMELMQSSSSLMKQTPQYAKSSFEGDLQSFSTILYSMSTAGQGSQGFYAAAEQFALRNMETFSSNQLQFVFFSFKFQQLHAISLSSKEQMTKQILKKLDTFSLEEIASILTNYRGFEEDAKKRSYFFQTVATNLEGQDTLTSTASLSQMLEVLAAFHAETPKRKISEVLPTFTTRFLAKIIDSKGVAIALNKQSIDKLNDIFLLDVDLLHHSLASLRLSSNLQ